MAYTVCHECMPCSYRIISEKLLEIHTMKKMTKECKRFSQTFNSFSKNLFFCFSSSNWSVQG